MGSVVKTTRNGKKYIYELLVTSESNRENAKIAQHFLYTSSHSAVTAIVYLLLVYLRVLISTLHGKIEEY